MRKLIRRMLMGAAAVWAVKALQVKKAELATHPASEIRQKVTSSLPEAVDPRTRKRIADKVVEVVKGPDALITDEAPPRAQYESAPPAPEPPADLRSEG